MIQHTAEDLTATHCQACEGEGDKMSPDQAREQLESLQGWNLNEDGTRISKEWTMKSFLAGIAFLSGVAEVAEEEGHHPDLHLENYRHVRIELSTHAVHGLSRNDFILAAKIDNLPLQSLS